MIVAMMSTATTITRPKPIAFETLDELLRFLADRYGTAWRYVRVEPTKRKAA
jgi:hypothetical protein